MAYTLTNFRRLALATSSSFTCHSFLDYLEAPPNIDVLLKPIKLIAYTQKVHHQIDATEPKLGSFNLFGGRHNLYKSQVSSQPLPKTLILY